MFGLGSTELLIILLIVFVLFGGSKIPQLGSALGQGIRNFRKSFSGEEDKKSPPPTSSTGNSEN